MTIKKKSRDNHRGLRVWVPTLACFVIPLTLASFSTGPGPGRAGAPGDTGNCAGGSCHNGAARPGQGIELHLPNGPFYRPGARERLMLSVTGEGSDPDEGVFGFQLTPRQGSLQPLADGRIRVSRFNGFEYAEHRRPNPERSWEIDWDAPASGEEVQFFAAANAANNSGDGFGDHIFLRSFTLRPAGPLAVRQPFGGGWVSPNAWAEIYGRDLQSTSTVQVGGRDAMVSFRSANQVNVRLAADTPLGWQTLEIRLADGRSVQSPIAVQATSPSLYPELPPLRAREEAVWYGTGCGALTAPVSASVRLGGRVIPATAYATPGSPGVCQIHFTTPSLPAGEVPVQVCVAEHCNGQRLVALAR